MNESITNIHQNVIVMLQTCTNRCKKWFTVIDLSTMKDAYTGADISLSDYIITDTDNQHSLVSAHKKTCCYVWDELDDNHKILKRYVNWASPYSCNDTNISEVNVTI